VQGLLVRALRGAQRRVGDELHKRGHGETLSRLDWVWRSVLATLQGGSRWSPFQAAGQPPPTERSAAGDASTPARAFATKVISSRLDGAQDLRAALLTGIAHSEWAVTLARAPGAGPIIGGAVDHVVMNRGKHIRSLCVLLCASVGRRRFPDETIAIAGAVELVHSATLLHDDVIDESDLRRGKASAPFVFGNAASVLAGDVLMLKASSFLVEIGRPDMVRQLVATMEEIVAAEGMQMANRGRLLLDEESYFDVIRGKTAALFRWACRAGALAGGRPEREVEALAQFGDTLGIAFQVADDILDVAGNPDATGKALFSDLKDTKATYPLIVAARNRETREMLSRILSERPDLAAEDVQATLARLVTAPECLASARERAREIAENAKSILSELAPGPAVALLRALADEAVQRDR
jgi:octaprenyl-diphosphate synthase